MTAPLILCSKSPWLPAVRREHAVAALAAAHGHRVLFLERPQDVRALRTPGRGGWLRRLAGRGERFSPLPGVEVRPLATLVPGHRNAVAEALDGRVLRHALADVDVGAATVVAMTPWQWPAVHGIGARRVVFDAADDWTRLIERRAGAFRRLYARIAREADAVVVVSRVLEALFPGSFAHVIRNGAPRELLEPEPVPPGPEKRLVYVGTLSENFDAPLLGRVLAALPEWQLDLYGQCQYAGLGDRPARELQELLDGHDGRVRWYGVVPKAELAHVLDRGRVLIVPLRGRGGRDTMKLFDYAARGRPIVTTRRDDELGDVSPPHLYSAATAAEFVDAVREADTEPESHGAERRRWAEGESWETRWPALAQVFFGAA